MSDAPFPAVTRRMLYRFIFLTVVVFTALAAVLNRFLVKIPWNQLFLGTVPGWMQITGGAAVGFAGVWILTPLLFHLPALKQLKSITLNVYHALKPSTLDALLISLAAGWGEELFFRGILQPLVSLPVAALLFALAHVGFKFRDTGMRQYFALSAVLGMALGFAAQHAGLITAMSAHAAWDFGVFLFLARWTRNAPKTTWKEPGYDSNENI